MSLRNGHRHLGAAITGHARDGEADSIDCGVGEDKAIVDAVDSVSNCETVERDAAGERTETTAPKATCRLPKVCGLKLKTVAQAARLPRLLARTVKRVKSRTVKRGRAIPAKQRSGKVVLTVSRGR